jgi:hypothetical protein
MREGEGAGGYVADCGRASGHSGPHREEGHCAEQRVLSEVRAASRALRLATDRLAWGLLTVRAEADVTSAQALAAELRQVQVRLASAVSSLTRLGSDDPSSRARR